MKDFTDESNILKKEINKCKACFVKIISISIVIHAKDNNYNVNILQHGDGCC